MNTDQASDIDKAKQDLSKLELAHRSLLLLTLTKYRRVADDLATMFDQLGFRCQARSVDERTLYTELRQGQPKFDLLLLESEMAAQLAQEFSDIVGDALFEL